VADRRLKWLTSVTLYTLAGSITSAAVGAALGALGAAVLSAQMGRLSIAACLTVTIVAAAREFGVISFPLPELGRQTNGAWAKGPRNLAPILWGLDLGMLFTTWFTFSGMWALVIFALLSGSPSFGAALLVAFWAGRALPVWMGPLPMPNARATLDLVHAVDQQYGFLRQVHAAALAQATLVLGAMLVT
jgi:hypothetical protein